MVGRRCSLLVLLWFVAFGSALGGHPPETCGGVQQARTATVDTIKAFIDGRHKSVLTFAGYSGAEYEDPHAMLDRASKILDGYDPARTLISIGATGAGIGAVYRLAKQKGFTTIGIVSTLARDQGVKLAKCVDYVFFVQDSVWGGRLAETGRISPTSRAVVEAGSTFVAIGGGDVTRDEMLAARAAGKPVTFIPADMNHAIARAKARKKGLPEPKGFQGSAYRAFGAKGASRD